MLPSPAASWRVAAVRMPMSTSPAPRPAQANATHGVAAVEVSPSRANAEACTHVPRPIIRRVPMRPASTAPLNAIGAPQSGGRSRSTPSRASERP